MSETWDELKEKEAEDGIGHGCCGCKSDFLSTCKFVEDNIEKVPKVAALIEAVRFRNKCRTDFIDDVCPHINDCDERVDRVLAQFKGEV